MNLHILKEEDEVTFEIRGKKYYGYIKKLNKKTAKVYMCDTKQEKIISLEKLTYLEPYFLSEEQVKGLCRYEILFSDLEKLTDRYRQFFLKNDYVMSADDFFTAMENIRKSGNSNKKIYRDWFEPLHAFMFDEKPGIYFDTTPSGVVLFDGLPNRNFFLGNFFYERLKPLLESKEKFAPTTKLFFLELQAIIEDEDKAPADRRYTSDQMETFINRFDSDEKIEKASLEEKSLVRQFADKLCLEDNITALNCKGYGCYGGNGLFKCDWIQALKCIKRLYELTGDPGYANSVGYIYYYGRNTDGNPDYENAFKYFSIGAAGGYYESKYKLADMFENGYGVVKNTNISYDFVKDIFTQNLTYIMDEKFDSKFADIALRFAHYHEMGYGSDEMNPFLAYYYYLQADYAISQRLKFGFLGDASVAVKIKDNIKRLIESGKIPKPKHTASVPICVPLNYYLGRGCKLHMSIKKKNEDNITLKVTLVADSADEKKKLFITEPATAFCSLVDSLKLRVQYPIIKEYIPLDSLEFDFDDIEESPLKDSEGGYIQNNIFKLGDTAVLSIAGFYFFTSPRKNTYKIHTLCSVKFSPDSKEYDYLLPFDDVKAGDTVIVVTSRGETPVLVTKVFKCMENELKLPLSLYKKVLKKADTEENK